MVVFRGDEKLTICAFVNGERNRCVFFRVGEGVLLFIYITSTPTPWLLITILTASA